MFLLFTIVNCAIKKENKISYYYNSENLDKTEYISLKENEKVVLINALPFDLQNKLKKYKEKNYILLGSSIFEVQNYLEPYYFIIKTAKEKGATLVLLTDELIDSKTKKYTSIIETPHTIYHSGNVSSSFYTAGNVGGYSGINYNAYTTGSGSYSGTSTYYTTSYVPRVRTINTYKQTVLFLVKKR